MHARPFMDLCPQSAPVAAADGAGAAARDGLAAGVRVTGVRVAGVDAPARRGASLRLGPLARLLAYLASRIALWASTLLIVGSRQ